MDTHIAPVLDLENALVPDINSPHKRKISNNVIVHVSPSSLKSKDAGQSTIPNIDIRSVEPEPPIWLSGQGLFYSQQNSSYGGFIGVEVTPYDAIYQGKIILFM